MVSLIFSLKFSTTELIVKSTKLKEDHTVVFRW